MRGMKTKLFALTLVGLLLLSPVSALACACCAETAHYFSGSIDLDEYPLSQLKRMRFARNASLYLTEAGLEEHSQGIEQPSRNYAVNGSFAGKVLKLTLRAGTKSGVLELTLPAKMWNHSADIHDGKLSAGGGPLLYKEWRLEGDVTGTGIFKAGTSSPAKYILLLQGRGNGCDNAEDFSNWRMEVKGEKARYAFHGKLTRPLPNR
jgi:hypothetical protein